MAHAGRADLRARSGRAAAGRVGRIDRPPVCWLGAGPANSRHDTIQVWRARSTRSTRSPAPRPPTPTAARAATRYPSRAPQRSPDRSRRRVLRPYRRSTSDGTGTTPAGRRATAAGYPPRRVLPLARAPWRREQDPRSPALRRVGEKGQAAIRANSVLPARREAITLHTADGLSWSASWPCPPDRDPVATLVCLHPLPTHGGMMDSHVFRKAAFRLPALAGSPCCASTPAARRAAGDQRGRVRQRRGRAVRRRRRDRVRRVPRSARHLAGRLVVRHRSRPDARPRPGGGGRDPALAAAAVGRRGAPRRRGPTPASR